MNELFAPVAAPLLPACAALPPPEELPFDWPPPVAMTSSSVRPRSLAAERKSSAEDIAEPEDDAFENPV